MFIFCRKKIAEELERAWQLSGSGSGADSAVSAPVNQYEILNKVLGERLDYQRGIGCRPKGKGKGKGHASTSSSSSQSQTSHSMSAATSEDMTAISLVIKVVQDLVSAPTLPPNPNHLFDARIHTFLRRHLPTQQEGASSHSPQPDPATPHSQQSQLPPQNF